MMFEGSVDQVTTTKATGWLYDRVEGRSSDVIAVLHGRIVGEASATIHRADLEQVGFGDGLCGFDLPFYEPLRDVDVSFVTVRPRGSNLAIPRTSEDTYIDLVGGLTAKHPGAGRNRSVLGGFWTDRTDALHILAGRLQTGSCSVPMKEPLRRLIANGYVVIPAGTGTPASPEGLSPLSSIGAQPSKLFAAGAELAEALVTKDLANILQAVFDDIPVAYSFAHISEPSRRLTQVSALERFTSPNEVLAIYLLLSATENVRLDFVRDSHEFPEFSHSGESRWTTEGSAAVPMIVSGQEQPIDSLDLDQQHIVIVGPGLIHRLLSPDGQQVFRLLLAPKRNTPIDFIKEKWIWHDLDLTQGIRYRAIYANSQSNI